MKPFKAQTVWQKLLYLRLRVASYSFLKQRIFFKVLNFLKVFFIDIETLNSKTQD